MTKISFVAFYIFFLLLLSVVLSYGLNDYIAFELDINPPTLSSTTDLNPLSSLIWIGQNMLFFTALTIISPYTIYGLASWFFVALTVVFGWCILELVRGV